MPKISGPTIAQHVAEQEAAVFEAATRLFTERGVDEVSMGAIADEVGLARPSLYRYFPKKSAILVRWFEQAMGPLIVECDRIADSDATRTERFDRWVQHQIEFLLEPSNRAMIRASLDTDELTDEQRQLLGQRHGELYASLRRIIGDDNTSREESDDDSLRVRIMLIVDMLRGLDRLTSGGASIELAGAEVLRASRLVAGMKPATTPGDTSASPLAGEWTITEIDGTPVLDDARAGLFFGDDATFGGNTGCNSFSSTYGVNGDELTLESAIAATLMACDPTTTTQESAIFAIVGDLATFAIGQDGALTLTSSAGSTIIAER